MKKLLLLTFVTILLIGIGFSAQQELPDYGSPNVKQKLLNESTFLIDKHSTDSTYGYTSERPIMVGGAKDKIGPINERRFLNALAGPNGEQLEYSREGSCCVFTTKNSDPALGRGLLDKYILKIKGTNKELQIYINMYDSDTLQVPVGLTLKRIE